VILKGLVIRQDSLTYDEAGICLVSPSRLCESLETTYSSKIRVGYTEYLTWCVDMNGSMLETLDCLF